MRRIFISVWLLSILVVGVRMHANGTDTRLLTQPAVSATHVAFVYAGDLWSRDLDGSDVRRLTTSEGPVVESGVLARREARSRSARSTTATPTSTSSPVDRRRADPPDVASRAGHRAGLHARRQERALHLAARGVHRPLHAALHRAG